MPLSKAGLWQQKSYSETDANEYGKTLIAKRFYPELDMIEYNTLY